MLLYDQDCEECHMPLDDPSIPLLWFSRPFHIQLPSYHRPSCCANGWVGNGIFLKIWRLLEDSTWLGEGEKGGVGTSRSKGRRSAIESAVPASFVFPFYDFDVKITRTIAERQNWRKKLGQFLRFGPGNWPLPRRLRSITWPAWSGFVKNASILSHVENYLFVDYQNYGKINIPQQHHWNVVRRMQKKYWQNKPNECSQYWAVDLIYRGDLTPIFRLNHDSTTLAS